MGKGLVFAYGQACVRDSTHLFRKTACFNYEHDIELASLVSIL